MKHLPRLVPPLAALAIGLAPAAAAAQIQTYYHAGAWDVFSGRGDTGAAVCGIGSTNPSDSRRFSVRFDIGGTDTTLSASKPNWSVPASARVSVVMQIGLNTPWTAQGLGHDHSIEWTLDTAAMRTFDRQFRSAASMTLTFPDGNEPPWTLSLTGSAAISDTFARCIRDLTRQVGAAQPQDSGTPPPQGATQPFRPPNTPAPAAPPADTAAPSAH